MSVESKLQELGLALPAPAQPPRGVRLPWSEARVAGGRVILSGAIPLTADGTIAGPHGKVGADVTQEEAYDAARACLLVHLGAFQRAVGGFERITGWVRVFGMVNAAPGFAHTPGVMNGYSDLLLELFGPEVGDHARTAIGVAALPFDVPVEVEAEVLIAPA